MNEFVIVQAKDWGHYDSQIDGDFSFEMADGEIFGLLVSEDVDKIVIAHQRFQRQLRHVTVVPKSNVVSVSRFPIEAKE
jgi:hypothetical protein